MGRPAALDGDYLVFLVFLVVTCLVFPSTLIPEIQV